MSVPAEDVTTDPLGKLLPPITNEELPSMVIDTDVVHNAPILSTKEISQDTADTVATTAARALQSKESLENITTVSQPATSFGPEETNLNAIECNSLPEVNIASHLAEAVEEGVQIFAPEAHHELYNAADQQSSHPLDPEITGTAVSTEIPDDVESNAGLPDPDEDTSKVSIIEAFTIAKVEDINVNQDSNVFASGKNNGDTQLPSAEETDRDTAVDSPPILAETGVELHEETLNPGNEAGIVNESDVSSTTAPELILGDGNTTNDDEQKQDVTEVSEAGHVSITPESVIDVDTSASVEIESDKGEILLEEEVVSVAGPHIVDTVLSEPPSEIVNIAVAHEAEQPPTVADAIQVSKLETPSEVYHVVEIEADPSINKELIETVAPHRVDAAILPVADISGTGNITADGLGISSELVDAPHADVQDIPLESVSQAVQEEQFVRESGSGPEETSLPSEGDILNHTLEVETLPTETLVDVAKPATTQAFEEVGIVEEILAPEEVSLDGGDCIQVGQVVSDSELSEPPTDASIAPVTAKLTDEETVQIAEHDKDVTEPTLAKRSEVFEGENVDFTAAQPLSNESARDALDFTASDHSDIQATTSATAPSEDASAGEVKEHPQDLQDNFEATTVIEEGTVKLEAGVQTKEEQLENNPKDSFTSTEIDNSSAHSQASADQVADMTPTHSTEDQISFEIIPPEEVVTNIVTPGVVPLGKARVDTEETIQETVTEVSVSQTESVIEGKIPREEPVADVNVPQEESVPDVNVPEQEPVIKASLLQEESAVEGNAPREEPVTEANVPQEELAIEVIPQEEPITQVNVPQEESLIKVNAPQEELVTSKNEPTSANVQVEEVAVAEKSAPIVEEVVYTLTLPEELVVPELPSEKGGIETTEKVEEELESRVPLITEESPALNIGIMSVEQQNPAFSAEPVNGVAPVPLLEQITPVVPTHSPDLATPNHQASETQVPAANTVSARDEVTYVPSEVPVVEKSILQHQDSVVEIQIFDDLTATQASEAQVAADAVVEPPATENVESSTLSVEYNGIDTEPSADGVINSEELPSAANDPHLINTDVTSIEHPNSPYIPSFMVTTIGYSSTSDKPSAPESPVDVDEQGTIAWEELLTAPVIQVESSETVQTDNEAPLDDSQLPARPWTPSYSVHSQGTPLVTAKQLDDEESDVPLNDVLSAELWTPSYSVHSQGTPLVTAKELDNEDADELVDNSGSIDANEPKLEETKFAKRTEQPEASPDSQPDVPQIQDSGPPPQHDLREETRELLGAVNHSEQELNLVNQEEASTSEIISDEQNKSKTGMGTSRDIPTVVTEEPSTEEAKQPMDQLEGQSHSSSWVPSYSVSSQGSPLPETRELQAIVEADSPSWVPSYSVSTQGSPLPETRELPAIIEAGSPILSMHEPITSQDSFEAAQLTPEHVYTSVIPVPVPPTSTELSTDEDYVQSERLRSEQCLDESTIHDQLPDISIPVLVPFMDAEDSQQDTWTPSYSVTTQGQDPLSDISIPVLVPFMDAEDSQKDTWTPSYSVTTQGVAQSHVEIFDVSSGSSSAAIGPLGEAAHDSNEPSPSLTSDILSNGLAIVDEQSNSDAFQSDIFDQLAIGQPTPLKRHPSEFVSEPRLASTGDETPTQTALALDTHAVVDVETSPDGLSHHIFPSADDTPREGAPDSKDKPVVPRLVPLEKCSNDTLHPQPSERQRLESTTSSRFFPGGWFSSSSTKSPNESRPSLELAQGEFIPTKSSTDGTDAIVSAVSPATTESFGDAGEADSTSSEEKRKWCIIM